MNPNEYPLVSIIMPVYNAKKYLQESIESIINQTYTNFEFIIIDDGSKDGSLDIISSYALNDMRIKFFKNTGKKGCYGARNFGINKASGKYIAVMDADDISLPERLEYQIKYMEANQDIGVCGTWFKEFGASSKIIRTCSNHNDINATMFFRCPIGHPTAIIRTKILNKNNLKYNDNYLYSQDYNFFSKIIKYTRFANIPQVLLLYRVHNSQISTSKKYIQQKLAFKTSLKLLFDFYTNKTLSKKNINVHKVILGCSKKHLVAMNEFTDWCYILWGHNKKNKIYNHYFYTQNIIYAWKTAIINSKYNFKYQLRIYIYSILKRKVSYSNITFFIKLSYLSIFQKVYNWGKNK